MRAHKSIGGKPPPMTGPDLTPLDRWYLDCLIAMTAQLGRAPSCLELGIWIGRSPTPVYRALAKLESLGLVSRDAKRRFVARVAA